jgi:hypothetical protein
MEEKIRVLGNDYTLEGATQKMKGHLSWLYWIAGLSLANLAYAFFGQDYFMVAGLGVDSYIASYFTTTDEDYYLMQQFLGFGFILFFLVAGYFGAARNFSLVLVATFVYVLDAILFSTVYFDIMSLLFHIWAIVSLVAGLIFMIQLRKISVVDVNQSSD